MGGAQRKVGFWLLRYARLALRSHPVEAREPTAHLVGYQCLFSRQEALSPP